MTTKHTALAKSLLARLTNFRPSTFSEVGMVPYESVLNIMEDFAKIISDETQQCLNERVEQVESYQHLIDQIRVSLGPMCQTEDILDRISQLKKKCNSKISEEMWTGDRVTVKIPETSNPITEQTVRYRKALLDIVKALPECSEKIAALALIKDL